MHDVLQAARLAPAASEARSAERDLAALAVEPVVAVTLPAVAVEPSRGSVLRQFLAGLDAILRQLAAVEGIAGEAVKVEPVVANSRRKSTSRDFARIV